MTQPRTEKAHVQIKSIIAIEDEKWPKKYLSTLAGLELATLHPTFFLFSVERLFCLGKVAEVVVKATIDNTNPR